MIFVDESIQQSLGYICVGFAYCGASPDDSINEAIINAGLIPGTDEYKSSAKMVNAEVRHLLRESIASIVFEQCKLGLYIAPVSERPTLLSSVSEIAGQIVSRNGLPQPQTVFIDEGIHGQAKYGNDDSLRFALRCNSKNVLGIQLADFVAYHCSYLLKCVLTGTSKKVIVEKAPHPLAGEEVELDWILRTELRRNFFVEYRNIGDITGDDWFFKLAGYGAYFSPELSPPVMSAATETFDSMYFGCVW